MSQPPATDTLPEAAATALVNLMAPHVSALSGFGTRFSQLWSGPGEDPESVGAQLVGGARLLERDLNRAMHFDHIYSDENERRDEEDSYWQRYYAPLSGYIDLLGYHTRRANALYSRSIPPATQQLWTHWRQAIADALVAGRMDRAELERFLADFATETAWGAEVLQLQAEAERICAGLYEVSANQHAIGGAAHQRIEAMRQAESEDLDNRIQRRQELRAEINRRQKEAAAAMHEARRAERSAATQVQLAERRLADGRGTEEALREARAAQEGAQQSVAAAEQHYRDVDQQGREEMSRFREDRPHQEAIAEVRSAGRHGVDVQESRRVELLQRKGDVQRRLRETATRIRREAEQRTKDQQAAVQAEQEAALSAMRAQHPEQDAGAELDGEQRTVYDQLDTQFRQQLEFAREQRRQQREMLAGSLQSATELQHRMSIEQKLAAFDAETVAAEQQMIQAHQQQQAMMGQSFAQQPAPEEMSAQDRAAYDAAMAQAQQIQQMAQGMQAQAADWAAGGVAGVLDLQNQWEAQRRNHEDLQARREQRQRERNTAQAELEYAEVRLRRLQMDRADIPAILAAERERDEAWLELKRALQRLEAEGDLFLRNTESVEKHVAEGRSAVEGAQRALDAARTSNDPLALESAQQHYQTMQQGLEIDEQRLAQAREAETRSEDNQQRREEGWEAMARQAQERALEQQMQVQQLLSQLPALPPETQPGEPPQ
jgi:hypothetical protein